jgi:hypothetical protein
MVTDCNTKPERHNPMLFFFSNRRIEKQALEKGYKRPGGEINFLKKHRDIYYLCFVRLKSPNIPKTT